MAKRGDPEVLRLVVRTLRAWARMTQMQFGKECRVAQPVLSVYESGKRAPSEAVLRRMAKVAQLDWSLVLQLCKFFSSFVGAVRSGSSPDARDLGVSLLGPALLAVTPYLKAHPSEPASPKDELAEAETIWAALEKQPLPFRRHLIEISPRAGSWALAVKACEASVQAAKHSAEEALELAELAPMLFI